MSELTPDHGSSAPGARAGSDQAVGPGPSPSSGDSAVPSLPVQLAVLESVEADLMRSLSTLGQAQTTEASLCEGWTRGHVLTHLARNAEALGNLVTWATTGERTPAYASIEARNAAIEDGTHRDVAAIVADVEQSGASFREHARSLLDVPPEDLTDVRTGATNLLIPGGDVPWHRVREVVTHHLDLDLDHGVHDIDTDVLRRLLTDTVRALASRDDVPALTLQEVDPGGSGMTWSTGDDGPTVRGTAGAFYLWLMRGIARDLRVDGDDLPSLPAWG